MASIYRRKNKDGSIVWRSVIRIQGYPSVSNHFERKQEAEDWAQEVERQIKRGQFKFNNVDHQCTFADLMDRYISGGALEHLRAKKRCPSTYGLLERTAIGLCACTFDSRALIE